MNTITKISNQLNVGEDEILIFQPLKEQFHPMAWLQSVGQFLCQESHESAALSEEGLESVRFEII